MGLINRLNWTVASGLVAVTLACQPLKKPDNKLPRTLVEDFGPSTKICSTDVVMKEVGPAANGLRPAKVEVQLGVCGHMPGHPNKTWAAIGAGRETDSVLLTGKFAGPGAGSEAKLFVDDQGSLFAVSGSNKQSIGKFKAVKRGSRLDGETAKAFQLMVGADPFSPEKHNKTTETDVWIR